MGRSVPSGLTFEKGKEQGIVDTRIQKKDHYVVSVIGEDKTGIVAGVAQFLLKQGFTIVDIEQTVIRSQFTMVLLIRPFQSSASTAKLRTGFSQLSKRLRTKIVMAPLRKIEELRLAEPEKPYVFTILGPDRQTGTMALTLTEDYNCPWGP